MSIVYEYLLEGSPSVVFLGLLIVVAMGCVLERLYFWVIVLWHEDKIVGEVLQASHRSLDESFQAAYCARHSPIGRFLLSPLTLKTPTPRAFRLALNVSAEQELAQMQKGDQALEVIVAVAPLLGLVGAATELFSTLSYFNFQEDKVGSGAHTLTAGIGEALISTATGMLVAVFALLVLQVLFSFQTQQQDYFSQVASEFEVIYRQVWYEPSLSKVQEVPTTAEYEI